MGVLLIVSALLFLCYGLWAHDWTVIGASLTLLVAWPLVKNEVMHREQRRQRVILDYLWADDDLSDSA